MPDPGTKLFRQTAPRARQIHPRAASAGTLPAALFAAAAVIVCLLYAGCTPRGGAAPPAKVVLITIDTTRADHLSAYGYDRETSPFLTALARLGVRFVALGRDELGVGAQLPLLVSQLLVVPLGGFEVDLQIVGALVRLVALGEGTLVVLASARERLALEAARRNAPSKALLAQMREKMSRAHWKAFAGWWQELGTRQKVHSA